ncbi:ComEC/Rec2 family competence protein [Nesterenkonia sandarakina]|uniref:Competence protein ComEC n=1 Tax=Nesterenkonia sandarakina TaxID=272918 RepID=A0A2T0YLF7_9MICC|nr:ComEC/Rec2 family competence protein [Nesterenkonia sandarakina]PRZ16110.1 competence protein ComEC [Nesterenkonia sandarakina]
MTARKPLDLRLLPTALSAWAVALAAVHLPWEPALQLGWILLGAGGLLGVSVGLFHRLVLHPAMLHALLCCVLAGVVALQAGAEARGYELSGWAEAVEGDAPVMVTLRISGQPELLATPGFGGETRVMARALVETASLSGAQIPAVVDAPVVIIQDAADAADAGDDGDAADAGGDGDAAVRPAAEDLPLLTGQRYQGLVRLRSTEPGQRETAVVFPFGEALERLPADDRAEFTEIFNRLRSATAAASSHALGDAPALLPGLILGDRTYQDEELSEAMRAAGLSHLTAVSGANCALVMGALIGTVRLLRAPRWMTVPVALIGLVLFVLLVHPEPSVIRAGVMGSIAAIALFAGRGRAAFSLLCLCVLGLLVFDPYYATEPAFQLSAAATAGIVILGTRIRERLEGFLPAVIAAPLALAFSAQLFVTPVLLPLSSSMSTYAVPANVLAAPFVPFITVPGTFAAVISTTLPWLAAPILWCCGLAAACLGLIGRFAAGLPQATAPWPEGWVGGALVVLYLFAAVVLAWGLVDRFRGWHVAVLAGAAAAVVALVLPVTALAPSRGVDQWRVALCDVGQGDMLVIRTQESAGVVVDAGEDPMLADQCLETLGVETVEALLLTHEHRDHYGGAPGVIEDRAAGSILHAGSAGWDVSTEVESVAELPSSTQVRRPQAGETFEFTDQLRVRMTVWAAESHHTEANDNSLVAFFEIADPELPDATVGSVGQPLRVLTLGDLEEEVASSLLRRVGAPVGVHLLKVAHHGAANGGTQVLEATRPAAALIGVGEDNSYGHPSGEILGTLEGLGAAVYRTDLHGTVVFTVDSEGFEALSVP